jgi:hypothetical protein
MKRRTIFFLTLSLLIILALVQATLVSAEEPTTEGECVNPETNEPCTTDDGEEPSDDEGPYTGDSPGLFCNEEDPDCGPDIGNPGNAKDVGKAGEKEGKHDFFYLPDDPTGTRGRSNPYKHQDKPHPSVQD